jgi:hypothetical protein
MTSGGVPASHATADWELRFPTHIHVTQEHNFREGSCIPGLRKYGSLLYNSRNLEAGLHRITLYTTTTAPTHLYLCVTISISCLDLTHSEFGIAVHTCRLYVISDHSLRRAIFSEAFLDKLSPAVLGILELDPSSQALILVSNA